MATVRKADGLRKYSCRIPPKTSLERSSVWKSVIQLYFEDTMREIVQSYLRGEIRKISSALRQAVKRAYKIRKDKFLRKTLPK